MPRQTYNRPDSVQLQPAAAPIGTAVSVGRGMVGEDAATALARGLGNLNQGLQPFIMNRMEEETVDEVHRQQQEAELELRESANREAFRKQVASGNIQAGQNPHKLRHMKTLLGQYEGEKYLQVLEASRYKDGKEVAPFATSDELAGHLASQRAAFDSTITDPDVRAGFLATANRVEQQFKAQQQQLRIRQAELQHELAMESAIDAKLENLSGNFATDAVVELKTLTDSWAAVGGPVERTRMNERVIERVIAKAAASSDEELIKSFRENAGAAGFPLSVAHQAKLAKAYDEILYDDDRKRSQALRDKKLTQAAANEAHIGEVLGRWTKGEDITAASRDEIAKLPADQRAAFLADLAQAVNATRTVSPESAKVSGWYYGESNLAKQVTDTARTQPGALNKLLHARADELGLKNPAEREAFISYGKNLAQTEMSATAQGLALRTQMDADSERRLVETAAVNRGDRYRLLDDSQPFVLTVDEEVQHLFKSKALSALSDERRTYLLNSGAIERAVRKDRYEEYGTANRQALMRRINNGDPTLTEEFLNEAAASGWVEDSTPLIVELRRSREARQLMGDPEFEAIARRNAAHTEELIQKYKQDIGYNSFDALTQPEAINRANNEISQMRDAARGQFDTARYNISKEVLAEAAAGKLAGRGDMVEAMRTRLDKWMTTRIGPVKQAAPAAAVDPKRIEEAKQRVGGVETARRLVEEAAKHRLASPEPGPNLKSRLIETAKASGGHETRRLIEAEQDVVLLNTKLTERLGELLDRESSVQTVEEEEALNEEALQIRSALAPKPDAATNTAYRIVDHAISMFGPKAPMVKTERSDTLGFVPGRDVTSQVAVLQRLKTDPRIVGLNDAELKQRLMADLRLSEVDSTTLEAFRWMLRLENTHHALLTTVGWSVDEALALDKPDYTRMLIRASDRQIAAALPALAAKQYGTDKPTPEQLKELGHVIRKNRDLQTGRR